MWNDLKTLFWLQARLTLSIFRSRRAGERLRVVVKLLQIVSFLFTLPFFVLMGLALAGVSVALLTPRATYELFMIVNNVLFLFWLLLPASYNSQVVERFEMSRLFAYPIPFRSIVVGSAAMSLMTMTGVWTVCLLLGEIIGLAWHRPLALPLILAGALPTFTVLVLTGRIMDDAFDLVAGDRRLRALVLTLFSLPFILLAFGQSFIRSLVENYDAIPWLRQVPLPELFARLERTSSLAEFLEVLRPSRLLVWLPAGWATSGMGLVVTGAWARAAAFLAGSLVAVALLLWVHAGITRQLMRGAALGIGTERVRSRKARLWDRLPGPRTFWALLRKDWIYLWRGPGVRRLIFGALLSVLPTVFIALQGELQSELGDVSVLAIGGFVVLMMGMVLNLGLTANYFGMVDREGFGTLALAPVDRRQVIAAANVASLLIVLLLYSLAFGLIALVSGVWRWVPLVLSAGLCLQISGTPIYTLASLIGPYRAQLKFTSGTRQRGNLWGMLAWVISALPIGALFVVPYFVWRPALFVTVPLAFVYSLGVYVLTLRPLAKLLRRREHAILDAVTRE